MRGQQTIQSKVLVLTNDSQRTGSSTERFPGEDVISAGSLAQVVESLQTTEFSGLFLDFVGGDITSTPRQTAMDWSIALQALNQSPLGMALLKTDHRLIWANPPMTQWFIEPQWEDKSFYSALGTLQVFGVDPHPITSSMRSGKSTRAWVHATDRYFRLYVTPLRNLHGEIDKALVLMIDDTESALQRQKLNALHQAELGLIDLTANDVGNMGVEERIGLLKENILHYTKDLLDFDVIEIRLHDQKTGRLEPLLSVGIDSEASKKPLYAKAEGNGVTGFVVATGHSYLCEDTTNDALYLDGMIGARSSLTVPLKVHDQVIGSFNVESPDTNGFDEDDQFFLESFARGVAAALNTLELLVAQRANTAQESVETICGAVANPIDQILVDAAHMIESAAPIDTDTAQRLRAILKNARKIKQAIQTVADSVAEGEAGQDGQKTPADAILKNKRILVVDADEAVRASAHQLLERYGCFVETSPLGMEAINMVRFGLPDYPYDAILADIRLPDIRSYDLLTRLQELMDQPPLILLTGFGYDKDHAIVKSRERGLRAGAVLYKPFKQQLLLESIKNIMKKQDV